MINEKICTNNENDLVYLALSHIIKQAKVSTTSFKARSHIPRYRYRHRRPISFKISVNIDINNPGHTWLPLAPICCPVSVEIDPRSIFLPAKNIGGLFDLSD